MFEHGPNMFKCVIHFEHVKEAANMFNVWCFGHMCEICCLFIHVFGFRLTLFSFGWGSLTSCSVVVCVFMRFCGCGGMHRVATHANCLAALIARNDVRLVRIDVLFPSLLQW